MRSGKSDGLFLLRDETGECIIDPDGAEVTSKEKSTWYGASATPTASPEPGPNTPAGVHGILGLTANFNSALGGQYRYTEEAIYPGDQLYAIGLVQSFGETDRMAMREELIKARLSQWKADHAGLLERFDRDGDGTIDLTEWEVARRAASREVTKDQLREDQQSLHTLSRTDSSRRPFLISAHAEYDLVKRFRYLSVGSIGGFFICGAIAVWMFTARFVL